MGVSDFWTWYKLVWKRRRLLWRAFRSRHTLNPIQNRLTNTTADSVLVFVCVRNEMGRLPHFLDYYRRLGVSHFLIVDNDSSDGTAAFLAEQNDVSLWSTEASYREARFGLDWISYLLMRYGHDRWCLHVDADELLDFAHSDTKSILDLTHWLSDAGQVAFGALMLDLYPRGKLDATRTSLDPLEHLQWFDAGPYRSKRQKPLENLWVQGGARERMFFSDQTERSPTLNKLPLVRWHWRYAYVNSTHSILPRHLNRFYDGPNGDTPSGVLLHTKFLPEVISKSEEDRHRKQHFHDPDRFATYYEAVETAPVLWHEASTKLEDWRQLEKLGMLKPGDFGRS